MKIVAFVMPWHISERGGGAEVQANYLAQELGNRGFDVHYICQTINPDKIGTSEINDFVKIHWLKPSGRFPWLDQNKYLVPLKLIQPDYVLQRLSSNVTYVISKYCSTHKCKFVWFCTDNKNPRKNFYNIRFKERSLLKSLGFLKYMLFYINSKIMDFFRTKGMKQVDIAFTQNELQEELVKRNFNLPSFKMISGHPLPKKDVSQAQRFKNKTILWCANWGVHKRPDLFIELASKMQHTDLTFIMVGGHSDDAYVKNIIKNKPTNLKITGHLPFDEALKYFDKTSLFVSTSISEGFSNTYIQSWLRSIPVVVFGADPDDIIKKNELGFDVESIDEASERISYVMSNYDAYQILSKNAFNYGSQNHTIKVMTDNFLSVLNLE